MGLPEDGQNLEIGDWMMSGIKGDVVGYILWQDGGRTIAAVFHDPALALAVWMMIQAAHRPEAKE